MKSKSHISHILLDVVWWSIIIGYYFEPSNKLFYWTNVGILSIFIAALIFMILAHRIAFGLIDKIPEAQDLLVQSGEIQKDLSSSSFYRWYTEISTACESIFLFLLGFDAAALYGVLYWWSKYEYSRAFKFCTDRNLL